MNNITKELNTILDWVRYATTLFQKEKVHLGQGCETFLDEALYLISGYLHLPFETMDYFLNAHLTENEKKELCLLLQKRIDGTPTAYLTHAAFLAGFKFYVNENTIIPRSFIGELLTQSLSPWVADANAPLRILDLCTGQGSLAILSAFYFPQSVVDAADISPKALAVAQKNVEDYGLKERVFFVESDGFQNIREQYDVIVCNPPYVNETAMQSLPKEFQKEPRLALSGGKDGLDFVRILLKEAKAHLKAGGVLVVEIGHNRATVEESFPDLPLIWLETSAGGDYVFLLHAEDL